MPSAPLISVLMSAYNAERFLAPAVRSILNQTHSNLELIICDDGSTDRTPAILDRFARRDPRIRLLRQPNQGLVAALNSALQIARGPYIARMDADDIALPRRLELQVNFMERNPRIGCVGGAWQVIDEAGRPIHPNFPPTAHADIDARALTGINPMCHPTTLMRRQVLEQLGGYDPRFQYAQDLDLWLRMAEVSQLTNIRQIVLQYRAHAGTISEARQTEQLRLGRLACELAWRRRGVRGEYRAVAYRPDDSSESRCRYALEYAASAIEYGHPRTAQVYALRALSLDPTQSEAWVLAVKSALGGLGINRWSPRRGYAVNGHA